MEQNGYIRKIDELGRIVIPKEIRSRLKIQDNENVLVALLNDNISITKYSYLQNNNITINNVCEIITEIFDVQLEVFDRENSIYSNHKELEYSIKYENEIIKDSVTIGNVILFSKYSNDFFIRIVKMLCMILSCLISNS